MKQFLFAGLSLLAALWLPSAALGQLVISEFMASNARTLADEDGEFSDWIEIHNPGPSQVSLQGWSLTDDPAVSAQWTFPATNVASGGYLVVFASGKNRRVPGASLHTGFRLSTTGDYLALVAPDGTTVSDFAPFYPPQATDVSFGLDPGLRATTLLPTNATGRFLVPADGTLGTNWLQPSFNDGAWQSVTSAVGYVIGALDRLSLSAPNLTNRLGAYWKFDESSGTTAADATGRSSTGSLLNFPADSSQWLAGRNDGALRFGGPASSDYVRVATYPRASNAITIAAWVFAESRPTWASIAKDWAASGGPFHFGLRDTGGDLDIFITTTSGQFSLRENTPLPLNQWQHVAFTADGSMLRLYRNGALVGSTAYSGTLVPPPVSAMGIGVKLNATGTAADTGAPGYWHGRIDDLALWHRALEADELQSLGSAGGLGAVAFASTVRPPMWGVNASAFLRFPFVIDNPSLLTRWRLKMRYDDGFIAWINGEEIVRRNAPESETLAWNSIAIAERPAAEAATSEEFNLAEFASLMVAGTNVLAIQGLNRAPGDHDFLVEPSLEASSITETTNAAVYFTEPTPGTENRVGVKVLGPIIQAVTHSPTQPLDSENLVVNAHVGPTFAAVATVTLRYRIQFGAEVSVPMFDDGLHSDGAAGDRLYGATIPAAASTNGQLVRYAISSSDVLGASSRMPIFNLPTDSDEYLGTVVQDPTIQTSLPVFHWFVATPALAESSTGTRCSLFYRGELYDNIFVRIRGGTSLGWPKKSYKIELNEDHEFELYPGQPRVTEFDLNTTYTDKSYTRSVMVYEHQRDAGLPSPIVFLTHLRQNSAFYSVTLYTEQPDKDFLRRVGLDPNGTFYKCGPGSTYDSTAGFEKKTRKTEGQTNVLAMLQGLGLSGAALEAFVFDRLDVPGMVNFMATVAITQNIDASDKNHFLYQDTEGSGEWRMLPWDQDLSFGPDALNTDTMVYNRQDTNAPACASHPYIGARPYMLHSGKYNRFLEAIVKVPRAREMLLRRIRTLTDAHLATGYFQRRIDELVAMIGPDVTLDKARWGGNVSFGGNSHTLLAANNRIKNEYLAPRLGYLTGTTIAGVGPANPTAQPPNVTVRIHSVEFNPASGNQAQEFVCLTNVSGFSIDLTGWQIDGGIRFEFPSGAVLPSNGVVYVAADVRAFRARSTAPRGGQGLFVLGNFQGQLSARGETILLRNQYGQAAQTFDYAGDPSPAQQFLRVTELMYHPSAPAGSPTDAEEFEFIELRNVSASSSISLTGVRFVNGIDFHFTGSPLASLAPGDSAVIVRNETAFRARYGSGAVIAGTFTGSLENRGERLQLVDAAGEEILDFSYDNVWHPITDGLGFSLVVVDPFAEPDAWSRSSQWWASGTSDGTPGQSEPAPDPIAPIVISEALTRTDVPPPLDTVELHNPTGVAVDVAGWYLTDDFNAPRKFRLPAGSVIPAGGFFLFDEGQLNSGPVPFALSSDGDEVWLFSADDAGRLTGYVHGHRFGAAENGVTFGRIVTSDGREHFAPQAAPTLNAANGGPRIGPIVIAEIHFHPADEADGSENSADEFVELRNLTGQAVELFDPLRPTHTWQLTGGVTFSFPAGRTLAGGAMALVVNFEPTNTALASAFRTRYQVPPLVELYGPLIGGLNNSSDRVELRKPTDPVAPGGTGPLVLVDEVEYQDSLPWPAGADGTGLSLQRALSNGYGNEPTNWVAAPMTAGRTGPTAGGRPVLLAAPASRNAVAYQTVQFLAEATGTPAPRYQWRFNDAPLAGATNASLLLNAVQPAQAGDYSVLVYNENGSVLSTNATLTLTYPAFILQQPATVLVRVRPDLQAALVTNATFQVTAYSPSTLGYQWRFNGQEIPGAVAASHTVTNVQVANAGEYTVWITDAAGGVLSAPASLIPLISPVLLQGPLTQFVAPGAVVTLSAAASGYPLPLGFEWRRGSNPLASNTVYSAVDTFRLTAASTPFTTNQYRVVIKNLATTSPLASPLVSVVTLPDFDQDGLIDAYEQSIGMNTNNAADALGDLDEDGMITIDEVTAGTDPLNPMSILRVMNVSGGVRPGVEFLASSNRTYSVQFTDRPGVGPDSWTKLRDVVAAPTARVEQVLDPLVVTNRVYRVVTPAQP